MTPDPIPMRVVRQVFAFGEWESVFRAPDRRLRSIVIGDYHGWTEASSTGMRQTEAPKIVARIYRFERAVGRLDAATRPALSELALDCGYCDQAHFNREFRAFVGCAPSEYRHLAAAG